MSIAPLGPGLASILLLPWLAARAEEPAPAPRPTITVRAVRPDRELAALLRLFEGSRTASPAAALSAWKRASREPKRLGKVGDALLATLNPAMVREFESIDAAEVTFSLAPGSDRWRWRAWFPHDDGTLAALGPTADLSGGAVEPPLGDSRVDRFPGPDLVLLARGPAGLFAANSREQLAEALATAAVPRPVPPVDSGWVVRVDPAARDTWTTPAGRRWAEAARMTRCIGLTGQLQFVRQSLVAALVGRFEGDTPVGPALDPDWLDAIPTRGPLAAVAFRVDPRADAWARLFDLVDRVERTDPARANVAPARFRLALAARAVGIRLEADVWPHLLGVSAWVGATAGRPDRAVVALHLDGAAPALGLVAGLKGARAGDGADEVVDLGPVAGGPLRVVRRRGTVFVAWGEHGWPATREALDDPARSARPWLGRGRTGALPTRVGAVWLDQLPLIPRDTPLAATLAESPPLRWAGANEGNRTLDEVWLGDLDATVRRFLDRLPLDPPPDR